MEKCRWCDKTGSWPAICKSTRDMEDKPHDPVCDAMLLRLGGGERICIPDVNDGRAIGVLVATSSKVGRYSLSNVQPLRDLAQSIGVILSPRQA